MSDSNVESCQKACQDEPECSKFLIGNGALMESTCELYSSAAICEEQLDEKKSGNASLTCFFNAVM